MYKLIRLILEDSSPVPMGARGTRIQDCASCQHACAKAPCSSHPPRLLSCCHHDTTRNVAACLTACPQRLQQLAAAHSTLPATAQRHDQMTGDCSAGFAVRVAHEQVHSGVVGNREDCAVFSKHLPEDATCQKMRRCTCHCFKPFA